jgi:hypothetical protein
MVPVRMGTELSGRRAMRWSDALRRLHMGQRELIAIVRVVVHASAFFEYT